ncbi:hypothetical protein [Paraburkholderia caribensis]|uniref:hypothetical protein n=1 Tax=Paraburkholderia caribensis TaxID=75105 RepID=UPI00131499F6|nr:hypothetical protein [Paraburkholderia caribensis]
MNNDNITRMPAQSQAAGCQRKAKRPDASRNSKRRDACAAKTKATPAGKHTS